MSFEIDNALFVLVSLLEDRRRYMLKMYKQVLLLYGVGRLLRGGREVLIRRNERYDR